MGSSSLQIKVLLSKAKRKLADEFISIIKLRIDGMINKRKNLSIIGLGTWGLGGIAYSKITEKVSRKIILSALNNGINFFDTADIYGSGLSETLLGQILSDWRHDVIIATKGGYTDYSTRSQCFTSDYLLKALEMSLKRLAREQVDYYLLHSPNLKLLESYDLQKTVMQITQSGLSKYIGVSVKNFNEASYALSLDLFDCIEIPFNLTYSIETNMLFFKMAKLTETLLIAKSPLNRGYLTNSFNEKKNFQASDTRAKIGATELLMLKQMNQKLSKAALDLDRSVIELAIQWSLIHRDIMIPVPGATSLNQLQENVDTSNKPCLTLDERNYLEKLLFNGVENA